MGEVEADDETGIVLKRKSCRTCGCQAGSRCPSLEVVEAESVLHVADHLPSFEIFRMQAAYGEYLRDLP